MFEYLDGCNLSSMAAITGPKIRNGDLWKHTWIFLVVNVLQYVSSTDVGLIGKVDVTILQQTLDPTQREIIHFQQIPDIVTSPFSLTKKDILASIERMDVLLAPYGICSDAQNQLRHSSRNLKKLVCFRRAPNTSNLIFTRPPLFYTESIVVMLKRLNWKTAILIGRRGKELWSLSRDLRDNDIDSTTLVYPRNATGENMHELLLTATQHNHGLPFNFLIIGDIDEVVILLKQAAVFDIRNYRRTDVTSSSQWVLVIEDAFLQRISLDIWLDNVAALVYPRIDSQYVLTGACNRLGDIYTLVYVPHGVRGFPKRQLIPVGTFNFKANLTTFIEILPNQRLGFNGRPLIVDTLPWKPFTVMHNHSGVLSFEGICIDMLHELSVLFNFTYILKLPDDGEWGEEIAPERWTGMIGELQNNKIDLVVAAIMISTSRTKIMDFAYPFFYDNGGGLYLMPEPEEWKTLALPFSWNVLLCIAITFLCSVAALFFMRTCFCDTNTYVTVLGDSSLEMWGIMVRYSYISSHQLMSARIQVISLSLFVTIISAAYCGNMMAFLAVEKTTLPFTTMAEVAEQNTFSWGTLGGSFLLNIFEHGETDVYKKLWSGIKTFNRSDPDVVSKSAVVLKRKAEHGRFVLFLEKDMLRAMARANCRYQLLQDSFYDVRYAIGLPLRSPYTELFSEKDTCMYMHKVFIVKTKHYPPSRREVQCSEAIQAFWEKGLFTAWGSKWSQNEDACFNKKENVKAKAVTINQLQSAFYLLIIGIFVSSLALLYEKLKSKNKQLKIQ